MEEPIIRMAEKKDSKKINELFIQMLTYICNANNEKIPEEFQNGYPKGYLDNFFKEKDKFILIAELNENVIGYLSCEIYSQEFYMYLDDFCVDSTIRGKGIGTKLINEAVKTATNNKLRVLKLHVDDANSNAIRFYMNLGFDQILVTGGRIEMTKKLETKGEKNE